MPDNRIYCTPENGSQLSLDQLFFRMGTNLERKATYLIPDLQRGYVWESKRITNLVDTLLKGWPFGQILLAKTGPLSGLFSPRTFFSKIVYFGNEKSIEMDPDWSDETCLVLDGQQRLQSLFIAMSPCSGGLVCDQKSWIKEYHPGKESGLWSGYKAPTAFLAVNIENYCEALEIKKDVHAIDFSSEANHVVLEWVFEKLDVDGQVWQRRDLLPGFLKDPWDQTSNGFSKYILLKDLWVCNNISDLPAKYALLEDQKTGLARLLERIGELKKVIIPYTQIKSANECGLDADSYNEMILSVFTRLNAGGKQLTREEITFSWIKRYWGISDYKAEDCINGLMHELEKYEITVKSDQLIRYLSNIWSALCHEGKLLTASDFLNGSLLKQIAVFLQTNWDSIRELIESLARTLQVHTIKYQQQFFSLDGFFLVVTWLFAGKYWAQSHPTSRVCDRVKFDSIFGSWTECRIDRFIFAGQWCNSLGNYIGRVYKMAQDLSNISEYDEAYTKLTEWFSETLCGYCVQAKNNISTLNRLNGAGVSAYTTHLWCWQRLDSSRKNISDILAQERGGITAGAPNVDHCVARNFWEEHLKKSYTNGSDVYNEKMSEINQIGNCNILCKSINCSKSDYTMAAFFTIMKMTKDDAEPLLIPEKMFSPNNYEPDDILGAIKERSQKIKSDLYDFLDGKISIQR